MRTRFFSEADDWHTDGAKITAPAALDAIRKVLDSVGPVIVEHWFYRGASAPARSVFDDYDLFVEYLNTRTSAGDAIDVWSWADVCQVQKRLATGKCPDDEGRVPSRGAY